VLFTWRQNQVTAEKTQAEVSGVAKVTEVKNIEYVIFLLSFFLLSLNFLPYLE